MRASHGQPINEVMKSIGYIVMLLFGCAFVPLQPALNHSWAQVHTIRTVNAADEESEEQKQKRIEECELTDRTKPNGDIKRVSQLCGHALSLPKPSYPEEAKSKRVSGTVVVEVVTNEQGLVSWAKAISGPELLRGASQKAACRARYSPTIISGRSVRTESTIQYFFELP
jgi:TonB family protein